MRILALIAGVAVAAAPLAAFGQEEDAVPRPRSRAWRDPSARGADQALPGPKDGYRTMGNTGVAVGGVLVLLGTVATVYAQTGWEDPCAGDQGYCYNTSWLIAKTALTVIGVVAIVQGVAFGAILGGIGFSRSAAERAPLTRAQRADEPRLRLVGVGIAPVPGGGMVGATLVF